MDGSSHSAPVTFGDLLRQHRLAAGLTQEALAERAGLSVRGISDLERGARTHPYRETVNMLASALGLAGTDRAAFAQRARRGRRFPGGVTQPRGGPLPVPLTSLVGREAEVTAVSDLLREAAGRLVTLTGPGGVGKTRLALAVADGLRDAFPGGVRFVDLAPLRHAADVTTAIGTALGVTESVGSPFVEQARRAAGERPLLLILDNFEHLLEGAPVVGDLLRAVPNLTVLATSREALRLRGERTYLVSPLAVPESDDADGATLLALAGAIQLFVERAQAVDAQFQLGAENVSAVSAICRRLDGLPLAIELAAARAKMLPPMAMLPRLERHWRC